jgi:SPX domain protein involved in polyphosphate accumulation
MIMDDQLEAAAKAKGKDPKDTEKVKRLANEIQYSIQSQKLRPGQFSSEPACPLRSELTTPAAP